MPSPVFLPVQQRASNLGSHPSPSRRVGSIGGVKHSGPHRVVDKEQTPTYENVARNKADGAKATGGVRAHKTLGGDVQCHS